MLCYHILNEKYRGLSHIIIGRLNNGLIQCIFLTFSKCLYFDATFITFWTKKKIEKENLLTILGNTGHDQCLSIVNSQEEVGRQLETKRSPHLLGVGSMF